MTTGFYASLECVFDPNNRMTYPARDGLIFLGHGSYMSQEKGDDASDVELHTARWCITILKFG